jgi:DNA-directed RNA polymerase subunit RPC12/RpoP
MKTKYEVRPDGPVICKECSSKGHPVEMKPYAISAPDADVSERPDTELESYRCPNCESVAYFRVS